VVDDSGIGPQVSAGNEIENISAEIGTGTQVSVVSGIESIVDDPIG